MKYEVITDNQGYVQIIRHTGTARDYVELDLTKYNLEGDRVYAYKLGKNELIWDEAKYEEICKDKEKEADMEEIEYLKKKLTDTDYIIARWGEEIVSLDNPLTWISDVIKINVKYTKEYKDAFSNRKKWRARIEELEKKWGI